MDAVIMPIILGTIIVGLGISNFRGNLASIHWYHRQRVTEADRKPFGRMVGTGNMLCGGGVILIGVFSYLAESAGMPVLVTVGNVVTIAFVAAGIGISFYAMIKYNKGIF